MRGTFDSFLYYVLDRDGLIGAGAPAWKMAALRKMILEEIWRAVNADELKHPLDFIVADTAYLYGPEEARDILCQARDQNDYLFIRLGRHRDPEDIEQLLALQKIVR